MNHRTIDRTNPNHNSENERGYFVQSAHGATVAGPFETKQQAWTEQDRLDDAARLRAEDPQASDDEIAYFLATAEKSIG